MNIIFIGDSITEAWELPYEGAINEGVPGEHPCTAADHFVYDVLDETPFAVHILVGTNAPYDDDIQVPVIRVMGQAALKHGIIPIIGIIPPRSYDVLPFVERLREMVESKPGFIMADYYAPMCNEDGSQNSSLFSDGTHPNAAGYAVMEGVIGPILQGLQMQSFTASLSADVNLNNNANYFDGPSVSQGTTGKWLVSANVVVADPNTANFYLKLWDGTTVIASAAVTVHAGYNMPVSLSGPIDNPAGDLRVSVRDYNSNAGKLVCNGSGNGKDCTITAVRIG